MKALEIAGVMPAEMLVQGAAGKLIVMVIVLVTLGLMLFNYKTFKGSFGKTIAPVIGGLVILVFFINPSLLTHDLVKLVGDGLRSVIRTVSGG